MKKLLIIFALCSGCAKLQEVKVKFQKKQEELKCELKPEECKKEYVEGAEGEEFFSH